MDARGLMDIRIKLLQAFLEIHHYDGILIRRIDNFAMATGGKRNYVSTFSDIGAYGLFVMRDGSVYFLGNNIEEKRALHEEIIDINSGDFTFWWYEDNATNLILNKCKGNIVSDDGSLGKNVHNELAILRSLLTEREMEKYRILGKLASEAMTDTLRQVKKGMSESEIAAILISEGAKRHCLMSVALVAVDQRIASYRHPIPRMPSLLNNSTKQCQLEKYAMVVGGFMREGLVVSMTRFVQVDDLSKDILDQYERICGVDALLQRETIPGRSLGDVFQVCKQAYKDMGFKEDEWKNHHQGGTTGYAGRTSKATPDSDFPILPDFWSKQLNKRFGIDVELGQAFAWNPSAPGVKSEDTFIMSASGLKEIVTATPSLPELDMSRVISGHTEIVKSSMHKNLSSLSS